MLTITICINNTTRGNFEKAVEMGKTKAQEWYDKVEEAGNEYE